MSRPALTSSSLSGLADTSWGKMMAGRRLAKREKCFRRGRRAPRSGCCSGGRDSHLGPPTDPKRMAAEDSHRDRVDSGRALPCRSIAAPPTSPSLNESGIENRFAVFSMILRVTSITSGPIPSPGRTAICLRSIEALLVGVSPRAQTLDDAAREPIRFGTLKSTVLRRVWQVIVSARCTAHGCPA